MRFMMIIKGAEGAAPTPELFEKVGSYTEKLRSQGTLLSNGGLLPPEKGAVIDLKRGELIVHDGPFTEAKELIGGFAILKVASKAEAIEHGRQFLKLHTDILGPAFSAKLEVREMFDSGEDCGSS